MSLKRSFKKEKKGIFLRSIDLVSAKFYFYIFVLYSWIENKNFHGVADPKASC